MYLETTVINLIINGCVISNITIGNSLLICELKFTILHQSPHSFVNNLIVHFCIVHS